MWALKYVLVPLQLQVLPYFVLLNLFLLLLLSFNSSPFFRQPPQTLVVRPSTLATRSPFPPPPLSYLRTKARGRVVSPYDTLIERKKKKGKGRKREKKPLKINVVCVCVCVWVMGRKKATNIEGRWGGENGLNLSENKCGENAQNADIGSKGFSTTERSKISPSPTSSPPLPRGARKRKKETAPPPLLSYLPKLGTEPRVSSPSKKIFFRHRLRLLFFSVLHCLQLQTFSSITCALTHGKKEKRKKYGGERRKKRCTLHRRSPPPPLPPPFAGFPSTFHAQPRQKLAEFFLSSSVCVGGGGGRSQLNDTKREK